MKNFDMGAAPRPTLLMAGLGLLALTLGGCLSPEQQRMADLGEDQGTCSNMGARYGSPEYTACMLQQQQRRDEEHLLFLEQARISQQMARDAQEMRERRRD